MSNLEFNHFDKVAVILVELSDENNIFESLLKISLNSVFMNKSGKYDVD
jgi:hypothetical protein